MEMKMRNKMRVFLILLVLIVIPAISAAGMLIGGETTYTVVKTDNLKLIGSKLGVDWRHIVKENNLDINKPILIGQKLRANNRKIVPFVLDNGILINIPDRMLYFFKEGSLEMAFPVGLGMPSWRGITRWRTPTGEFTVTGKIKNPTWHVPKSMQWKMKMEGKPVKTVVPPGPDNPLGRYAIRTSLPGIVIHENIWPASGYQFTSHGCVRVLPKHMEEFFGHVEKNTQGEIIYMPVKVLVTEDKRVFVEVHRDIYGKVKNLKEEAIRLIEKAGVSDKVNWEKIDILIKEKSGIAEEVSL
jgi:L,D-transpeptidase ErfK/SrfK